MSVRAGLLAILSLGPAYGLQVRDEFLDRAPHRPSVNVGQIYSTLDRLMTAGLVRNSGMTDDGLPLYALTDAGDDVVADWIRMAEPNSGDRVDDLLDQVLIVSSLPGVDVAPVVAGYRAQLAQGSGGRDDDDDILGDGAESGRDFGGGHAGATVQGIAAEAAKRGIREALVAWLDDFQRSIEAGGAASRPRRDGRPSRGRRPGSRLT